MSKNGPEKNARSERFWIEENLTGKMARARVYVKHVWCKGGISRHQPMNRCDSIRASDNRHTWGCPHCVSYAALSYLWKRTYWLHMQPPFINFTSLKTFKTFPIQFWMAHNFQIEQVCYKALWMYWNASFYIKGIYKLLPYFLQCLRLNGCPSALYWRSLLYITGLSIRSLLVLFWQVTIVMSCHKSLIGL